MIIEVFDVAEDARRMRLCEIEEGQPFFDLGMLRLV
jgi:hypothetical protein